MPRRPATTAPALHWGMRRCYMQNLAEVTTRVYKPDHKRGVTNVTANRGIRGGLSADRAIGQNRRRRITAERDMRGGLSGDCGSQNAECGMAVAMIPHSAFDAECGMAVNPHSAFFFSWLTS
jgi:hypothetical protein